MSKYYFIMCVYLHVCQRKMEEDKDKEGDKVR